MNDDLFDLKNRENRNNFLALTRFTRACPCQYLFKVKLFQPRGSNPGL